MISEGNVTMMKQSVPVLMSIRSLSFCVLCRSSSFVCFCRFRFATELVLACDVLVLWHSTPATMYCGNSSDSRVAEGDRAVSVKTSNPYATRG